MERMAAKTAMRTMLLIAFLSLTGHIASAQYFGRNKPQYKSFDFNVLKSPHFDIYNYLEDDSVLNDLAEQSEIWYKRHQLILEDTFKRHNPIIIYNNHADFQQTGIIGGIISVGTGGVTEGLKNRVIFPFLQTNKQTDHVLGHELVHAFQYHMLINGDSTNLYSVRNLPLWMVEGMAEYMSTGRTDAHTAMWMRDAIISDDFPSLKDMQNPKYFPYRYGQAFWSFTAGVYGDTIVKPLFIETAKLGYEQAIKNLLKIDAKALGTVWKNTLKETYKPFMEDTIGVVGQTLFSGANAGDMNISPVYSPDGKYVAFLSEKDVISIDLYLADAKTGKIIRKLSKGVQNLSVDDYDYIESTGTFSPDSKKFAYVIFSKGKNKLLVAETGKGNTLEELEIPGLPSFSDPAWSPDGKYIVVSGLKDGQTDLYLYNYITHDVTQLTDDRYSEIQPAWSADGKKIVFSSDRGFDTNIAGLEFGSKKITVLNLENQEIKVYDHFPRANNLNPQFAGNDAIFFLSDADGFRNLYRMDVETEEIVKLTKYFTGISGITKYSPAITVSQQTNKVAYSIFREGKYTIFQADLDAFPEFPVDKYEVDLSAATLPPLKDMSPLTYHQDPPERKVEAAPVDSFQVVPYRPKFNLAHISNNNFGVGTSAMGTGFNGGVNMLFSDIMNEHQLFAGLQLNGEIYDFGGQVMYLNRESKLNWGGGISHIPYLTGGMFWDKDTIRIEDEPTEVDKLSLVTRRIFQDQITLFSQIPFSQTLRLEGGASYSRYYYRTDSYDSYYLDGFRIGSGREKLESPDGFNVGKVYLAYVGDNSRFGVTSPMMGKRFRFQVEKMFGEMDYTGILADYRQYYFAKPFTFAFRGMHYGRYGGSQDSEILYPVVIGSDYLVRGYDISSIRRSPNPEQNTLNMNQLVGSKMAVFNAEVRFPFTGPKKLALFKSGLLFSDLALFADAGMVWNRTSDLGDVSFGTQANAQKPIISTGVAMRINLFGYMVLEPYYAFPFMRNDVKGTFGLTLSSGGW
ncbi:MAG: BamA/TamA family outer membrane protein [Candidatus Cyclobacteriaceae bacterium M3_2C_046]